VSNKTWALLVGLLVGVGLGIAILFGPAWIEKFSQAGLAAGEPASGALHLDQPAPDFALHGLDWQTVHLSDLRGRVVVLNFWATWCNPCVLEMPVLQRYASLYPDDLVVVGVNMQESETQVRQFIDQVVISYPILLDSKDEAGKLFQVIDLPNTFFIDQQGFVRQRHIGQINAAQVAKYLSTLGISPQE
jgi:cytochrome c biogenesis protein CcmG/thiol:disulfide interchange protein DsbE